MMKVIPALVLAVGVLSARQHVSAQAEDIRKGINEGTAAGRATSVLLPLSAGVGTAAALALSDNSQLNNNRVVSALVLNTAISAGVTALASILLPPRPSGDQRRVLDQQSALYANSWRSGFRETARKRRFNANVLSVLAGAATTAVIYSIRSN